MTRAASLAPRDIVARAIDREIKRTGAPLRVSRHHATSRAEFIIEHFPNIYETLPGRRASTSPRSRFPWCLPRITNAAAC